MQAAPDGVSQDAVSKSRCIIIRAAYGVL